MGISLDDIIAIYKDEEKNRKSYRLDIQIKWKEHEELKPGKGMVTIRKATKCDICLIDNQGNKYPIKLEATAKALYLTFLLFEDGIAYTQITYSDEFYHIFKKIYNKLPWSQGCPGKFNLEDKTQLDTFTNYISKIRKAILLVTNDTYAQEQFAVEGWRKGNYGIAGADVDIRKKVRKEFRIK